MTQNRDIHSVDLDSLLADVAKDLFALAEKNQHDNLFLLSLLRSLEQIHRQIRVNYFDLALPQTRNDLYQFVREIEEQGGWPYIERMRLKELLQNLEHDESVTDSASGNDCQQKIDPEEI